MVFKTEALVFLVIMFCVYRVGRQSRHYDYAKWASNQTFQVGDFIRFVYNPTHHKCNEVSSSDYESCNAQAPLTTYITGNDSIPLTKEVTITSSVEFLVTAS
ncbi:hypothetical protein MKX03_020343 [Papaver bracteatum]|nr:hypothetical protein MKX03_020343 [Papaver bracteatum]